MEIYKNITDTEYLKALEVLSNRMFKLFDNTGNTYNNRRGDSLMWLIGFTGKLIACEAVEASLKCGKSLTNSIIEVLNSHHPNNDLLLLLD